MMFARYFTELPLPRAEVERALLGSPSEWVPGVAQDAQDRGESLLVEVGFGSDGRRVSKQVEIEVGHPLVFPSKTVLPISWRATRAGGLFPALDADIEVADLGRHRTQFSISARYEPPFGLVGRTLDRALLHRVAEATLKDFMDRLSVVIERKHAAA